MANQTTKNQQQSGGMVSWSGARLSIKAFWNPEIGDMVKGVLLQRNRDPRGKVRAPFYVLQLTAPTDKLKMKDEAVKGEKGDNIAVSENAGLSGLEELLGYEVQIKLLGKTEFATDDGELREIKEFDVKHSAEVVNQAAAQRYRPQH